MFRPESLAALDGLDRVLGHLEKLAQEAPRRYRIVALSDHGQSQGRPFEDRHGTDLGELCVELMAEDVTTVDADVEGWGRAHSIVGGDVGAKGASGRVAVRAERLTKEHTKSATPSDRVVVLGSSNLGLLYVRGTQRLSLEELDSRLASPGGPGWHTTQASASWQDSTHTDVPGRSDPMGGVTWRPGSRRAETRSNGMVPMRIECCIAR